MRKGRSSRRSRISRPLVSVKGEALSGDVGPASGGVPSPRVVVGLPASEPPASYEEPASDVLSTKAESRIEAKPPATMPSFAKTIVGGIQLEKPAFDVTPLPLPEPEALPAEEDWRTPPPPDLTKTLVETGKREEKREKPNFANTLVHGSPAIEEPPPDLKKTLTFGSSKLSDPPRERAAEVRDRKEARERLKDQRAAAQAATAAAAPSPDPDEISVPPVSDLKVEREREPEEPDQDIESERFFSEGDLSVHLRAEGAAEPDVDEHYIPEKARRKSLPHVAARRAKLAGYVRLAVAGAAFVCLAALGSSAFRGKMTAEPRQASQVVEAPVPPPKAAEPAAAPPAAPEPAKAAEPAKAEEPAAKAEEPAAEAPPTKAEEIAGDAKEELKKSRTALERGKLAEAIEAGERAVVLDPTDSESWLILGAAYQEKGNMVDARRCYSECLKQGKTGPRSECAKMLH